MMTVEKSVGDFYFHSGDNLREIGDLQKKKKHGQGNNEWNRY